MYARASSQVKREHSTHCGIDNIAENAKKRSYTNMQETQFWKDGKITWSFVSNGDEYAKFAAHTDRDLGLSKADVETAIIAMKQIEEKTCIKFNRMTPTKGDPYLLLIREAQYDDQTSQWKCNIAKATKMIDKDFEGLGKIYSIFSWADEECFGGAYAMYGAASPQSLVISMTLLDPEHQTDIGLVAHELMHNLGLGHTQKRQDADKYIDIQWNNIETASHSQYFPCIEEKNPNCKYYNDYGTPYDCSSIMHYQDWMFLTQDANNEGGKTMIAKDPNTCDVSSSKSKITDNDISLMNKMYCQDSSKVKEKEITSPNYPNNYPDNQDKNYKIKVAEGSAPVIKFTHFTLEGGDSSDGGCDYDWVWILDGDGSVLMDKACGTNIPPEVTGRTNVMVVKFHSDSSENFAGFKATWHKGESAILVDGGWSTWSGWSSCKNAGNGKSICKKRKMRNCNNPPPSNGGKDCPGSNKERAQCTSSDLSPPEDHPLCEVTGGWSAWSESSVCSKSCTSTKTRTCTNPAPINHKTCEGDGSETSSCMGGNCVTSSGTISSPNYPSNYSDYSTEFYDIIVPAGSTIELTFIEVDIENSTECNFDYVEVLNNDEQQLGKFCGQNKPSSPLKSTGNMMYVLFISDSNINHKGFQATWKEVKPEEPVLSSGSITFPSYEGDYKNDTDIKVETLNVATGDKIKLTITDIAIEDGHGYGYGYGECPYDYLKVYDGERNQTICGFYPPDNPIVSTSNVMTLYFFSDPNVSKEGFKATWEEIAA